MDGQRFLVERTFVYLPGRPSFRLTVVKHHQTDAPTLGHQFLPHPFVIQRHDVAMFIHLQAVDAILYALDMAGLLKCWTRCGRQAIDSHSSCWDSSLEKQLTSTAELRLHTLSSRVINLVTAPFGQVYFDHRGNRKALIIIYYHRYSLDLRIQLTGCRCHTVGQHCGKLLQTEQLIIPRVFVCLGNAGTCYIVMKLVPDDATPDISHQLTRIGARPQPVGHYCHALCSITEVFVLSIVEFHGCLRRVTAIAMQVHRQFTIEYR